MRVVDGKVRDGGHGPPYGDDAGSCVIPETIRSDGCVNFATMNPSAQHLSANVSPADTDLFPAHLPAAPARVLVVETEDGTLAEALAAWGYEVTRIAGPTDIGQALASLENGAAVFAVVVIHDTARDLDLLSLFSRAFALLAEGGTLLAVDDFLPGPEGRAPRGPQVLPFFIGMAGRCGFTLAARTDPDSRDTAHVRALLRFTRGSPQWRVSDIRPADAPAMRTLFSRVFGQEMSEALWRWKYGGDRGRGVIAKRGTEVIAHYGGMTREIRYRGRPMRASQICDVMVDVADRGALTRRGPFTLTAESAAELFSLGHGVGFGFPNRRAMVVAERLGLYEEVGRLTELHWPPLSVRPRLATRIRPYDPARDAAAANGCWAAMAADLDDAIVGVRDAAWIARRYLDHPVHRYEVLLVTRRFGGRPPGLIVLRLHDDRRCELVDLVGPFAALPALVVQARRVAGMRGATELYCWISEPFAERLRGPDGETRPLDVRIPTSIHAPGPPVAELMDRWWLMGGDTDFR